MSFHGGDLYLALGDGAGTNGRSAQDYTSLLGGIIRIVPRTTGPGYDVPLDNPFVADPASRAELWAKGLRSPWGFWRDPATGDLWTADVGDHTVEEIDRVGPNDKGVNFGWYFFEGDRVNHSGGPADVVPPASRTATTRSDRRQSVGVSTGARPSPRSQALTCSRTSPAPRSRWARTTR